MYNDKLNKIMKEIHCNDSYLDYLKEEVKRIRKKVSEKSLKEELRVIKNAINSNEYAEWEICEFKAIKYSIENLLEEKE